MFPLNLYAHVRILLMHSAHETAGAARTRSSLRPLLFGARLFPNLGHMLSRERGRMPDVVARIERSEIREQPAPDFTPFNPGYCCRERSVDGVTGHGLPSKQAALATALRGGALRAACLKVSGRPSH